MNIDEQISEMEKQLGITFDRNKLSDLQHDDLLNFVELNSDLSDLSQDEIDEIVSKLSDAIKFPEVIEQHEDINSNLGLSPEDLKQLYAYISGRGEKPLFLDRYMADSENKLKDFQQMMTLVRLSSIPQLAALNLEIQKKLYSPENLLTLDTKELSQASANLSKEMSDILNNAVKSIELVNSMGRVDSRYRSMMDKLLVVPDEVLNQIEHLLSNYQ